MYLLDKNIHELRAELLMKADITVCFKSKSEMIKVKLLSHQVRLILIFIPKDLLLKLDKKFDLFFAKV